MPLVRLDGHLARFSREGGSPGVVCGIAEFGECSREETWPLGALNSSSRKSRTSGLGD